MALTPLVFEPYLRPQIWGGRNLQRLFGKKLPSEGLYGESWEISSHALHVSRVAEGPLKGTLLTDLVRQYSRELLGVNGDTLLPGQGLCALQGSKVSPFTPTEFPLLIKLLDCQELVSIQVHPNDESARRLLGNERGKTEAWVVLDVGPEGRIYAGFQEGVGRDDVLRHFRAGTLDQCLHSFQPRPGDCIFLRAGTVHAVGGGVILAEVQQTSDATFRLYDWNRLGSDGKPRALHIEQALESLDFSLGPVAPVAKQRASGFNPEARCCAKNQAETLVRCDYFRLDRFHLNAPLPLPYADRFSIWIVAAGSAELRGRNYRRLFQAGETVLVPACTRELSWEPDGNASGTAAQLLAILG